MGTREELLRRRARIAAWVARIIAERFFVVLRTARREIRDITYVTASEEVFYKGRVKRCGSMSAIGVHTCRRIGSGKWSRLQLVFSGPNSGLRPSWGFRRS
jgi:hypothetical protein